jgi:APA family basic amino acid/polyamine antiporter
LRRRTQLAIILTVPMPSDRAGRARIGLWSAVALVVANMIGAGVFTTAGFALADLGSRGAVMAAWVLGGVIAVLGALSYSALAVRWPHSGGEYEYLRRALHPAAGIVAGFVSMLAGFSAPIAAAAAALEEYGWNLAGARRPAFPLLGTAAIVLAAVAHGVHVSAGARVQNAIVVAKTLLIGTFLLLGARLLFFGAAAAGPLPDVTFTASAFGTSLLWIYLAYSGWNAAVYIAGEVDDARAVVPRALLLGTVLVAVAYIALNAVFLWAVPAGALAGRAEVAAIAARALVGRPGEVLVTATVMLALLTSVTAMLMAGPRVYARMAQDRALPAFFAPTATSGAPRRAIALQAALALLFLWVAELQDLMTYIGWTLSVSAAATVVAMMRVRLREGQARVPCFGWPLVPLGFVAAVVWFTIVSIVREPMASLAGSLTLLAGGSAAWWMQRRAR